MAKKFDVYFGGVAYMKIIRPEFWKRFQCIGENCTDNCCIGWEICIDQQSLEYYKKIPGQLGEKLKKSMEKEGDVYHFAMHNGRCVFLNEKNLCELIVGLGNGSLCDICREHPRFYEDFGVRQEAGLGLCCEEAVRLLLEHEMPLKFEMMEIEDGSQKSETYEWFFELDEVRTLFFKILQNRELSWKVRLMYMLVLTDEIQEQINKENPSGIWEILETYKQNNGLYVEKTWDVSKELWIDIRKEILKIFLDMEVMDETWKQRLMKIGDRIETLYEIKELYRKEMQPYAYEMEHLLVYQLFRYFLKGIDDEDILSKSRMAVVVCMLVELLHMDIWYEKGELKQWDRIVNIKACSKELEYCMENVETLMDTLWDGKFEKMYLCW